MGNVLQLGSYTTGGTWSSANNNVATVSSTGEVTGISEGAATINYSVTNTGGCVSTWPVKVTVAGGAKIFGNSLDFDGIDDYVSVSPVSYTGGTSYTLEAWVKPDINKNSMILNWGLWTNTGISSNKLFLLPDGTIVNQWSNNGAAIFAPQSLIADGAWHHIAVAVSYVGGIGVYAVGGIYVDGVLRGQGVFSAAANPVSMSEYLIGQAFDGKIDEVRVWSVMRTEAQIKNTMGKELIGTEPGLVAYYDFNTGVAGGSNNSILYDKTYSRIAGIPQNFALSGPTSNFMPGAPVTIASNIKNALYFDGIDDYVNIDNSLGNFGTGDFTVEFNIKTTMADRCYVISKRNVCSNGFFWDAEIRYGRVVFSLDENGSNFLELSSPNAVNDGSWHHIAAVRNAGVLSMYIDGLLKASSPCLTNLNNTTMLQLGTSICNGINGSKKFAGAMDELRFWNVARTVQQIQSAMNKELAGNEPGLIAHYSFNQGTPNGSNAEINYLVDKTSTRRHGILTNFGLTASTSNWVSSDIENKPSELCRGGFAQLNTNIVQHGNWSGSNNSIASVDSTGLVTGIASGVVTVYCSGVNEQGCETYEGTTLEVVIPSQPQPNTGNGLHFDGVNDYVNLNTTLGNFGTGDFTVEFNIKTNSSNQSYVISKRSVCNTGYFWNIQLLNGKISIELNENGSNIVNFSSTVTINNGNWHHVALVRKMGILYWYIDGGLNGSTPGITNLSNTVMLQLGTNVCNGINGSNKFAGTLDELRFWNIARTQTQIQQYTNTELATATEIGLVAYYKMNQGAANGANGTVSQLMDSKPFGSNGTLTNFALNGSSSNWVPGVVAVSSMQFCANYIIQLNNQSSGVRWWSANTSIATVNNSGLVTTVAAGRTSIYCAVTSAGTCMPVSTSEITVANCGANKGGRGDDEDSTTKDPFLFNRDSKNVMSVKVIPNPNAGAFAVSFDMSAASAIDIKLIDMQGKTLFNEQGHANAGTNKYVIQSMNLNSGIYFLKINTGEFSTTEKIVIEK